MTITGEDRDLFERSLRHATSSCSGEALDAALDDLGWHDAFADDPRTAVSLLFELQGLANATSSALDGVMGSVLGVEPGTAVVLGPFGVGAPGPTGLALSGIERAELAVVGGSTIAVEDLRLRTASGMDPALGLVLVTVAGDPVSAPDAASWAGAVAAGQRALAHEIIGAARAMLELARLHAIERIQFDRPIAQFQAVRHRLAETLVAIEGANDALAAAWEDGSALSAAAAKAIAGRSARVAAKHCQQVLAGIGFTLEHPFHHHLRRVLVLDRLLGDSRSLSKAIGEELLRTRQVPPMLPL
jgi:hypothetical protein